MIYPLAVLLDREASERLRHIVHRYRQEFEGGFRKLLAPVVDEFVPPTLQAYLKELERLHKRFEEANDRAVQHQEVECEIPDVFGSVLRDAVISARLSAAERVEARRAHAVHPELLANLDAELRPYDAFLRESWFLTATSKSAPQLADFFPIQDVEAQLAAERGPEYVREYDEKFHILQAPSLFLRDLDRARKAAALRGIFIAAAYLDIDNFKDFNTEKGEPYVDRYLLPKFMRKLEAHVYTRGYAYRYGGDEYCVLLNNITEDEALASMHRLRECLGDLTYEGISRRTTVSVGVVIVRPDCHLTGHEIELAAAAAKKFAKDAGRNLVATYNSPLIQAGDLRIENPVVF